MWISRVDGCIDVGMFGELEKRGSFGGDNRIKQRTPRDGLICSLGWLSKLPQTLELQNTHCHLNI